MKVDHSRDASVIAQMTSDEDVVTPRPLRRRRDMCPHAYRAALVDQGFAWLGAEIGLFVDIRHPVSGRYFKPLRDERGHVLRTETLAALILWRAELSNLAVIKGAAA